MWYLQYMYAVNFIYCLQDKVLGLLVILLGAACACKYKKPYWFKISRWRNGYISSGRAGILSIIIYVQFVIWYEKSSKSLNVVLLLVYIYIYSNIWPVCLWGWKLLHPYGRLQRLYTIHHSRWPWVRYHSALWSRDSIQPTNLHLRQYWNLHLSLRLWHTDHKRGEILWSAYDPCRLYFA